MDVSSVGSVPQVPISDLTQLLKEVNQTQVELLQRMLQVQAQNMVASQKMDGAEDVQGTVDYYA